MMKKITLFAYLKVYKVETQDFASLPNKSYTTSKVKMKKINANYTNLQLTTHNLQLNPCSLL